MLHENDSYGKIKDMKPSIQQNQQESYYINIKVNIMWTSLYLLAVFETYSLKKILTKKE